MPTTRAQTPDGAAGPEQAQPTNPQPVTTVETAKAASPNTTGQPLVVGAGNAASGVDDRTTLYNLSSSELMPQTFVVNNFSDNNIMLELLTDKRVAIIGSTSGVDTTSNTQIGVLGASERDTGVWGYSAGLFGSGVYGQATGAGGNGVRGVALAPGGDGVVGVGDRYGGYFIGERAAIYLSPSATAGAPTTGSHSRGELVVSSDGHLWFCRTSGTPGEWVRLDLGATFVPLIQK